MESEVSSGIDIKGKLSAKDIEGVMDRVHQKIMRKLFEGVGERGMDDEGEDSSDSEGEENKQ